MTNKLVSVVVPVYNVKDYLRCCLNSIIQQTYSNIELILVDDGSTDGSEMICDEYSKLDSRIKCIHQENQGLSAARNIGIENAEGEYIAFVDSDDYISPLYVETLLEHIITNDADISICSKLDVYDDSAVDSNVNDSIDSQVFSNKECIIASYSGTEYKGINAVAWGKLYKTSLFIDNAIRFPIGKLNEDIYTTYKLYYYSNKIVYLDRPMYFYRKRSGSIMSGLQKDFSEKNMMVLEGTEEAIRFYFDKNEEELATLAVNYHLRLEFGLYYKLIKNRKIARIVKRKYGEKLKFDTKKYLDCVHLSRPKALLFKFAAYVRVPIILKVVGV